MGKTLKRVGSFFIFVALFMVPTIGSLAIEKPFEVESKAALLMDFDTGTILYEENSEEKLPIASITKIMTTLLALEAIEEGKLSLEDDVTISEYAGSMGGSQVFLSPGEKLPVSAILKAIIVASGNDASVAIAEKVSGTVETFVSHMNQRARELGMKNTGFADCTGLSDEGNYSSAHDVAIMSRELLKHSLFFKWSTIWLENLEESENKTELTNTNRLVRFYDGCDGVKTGSTQKALSCLSASAKRGNLRLISVVLGSPTSQIRFQEAAKLMDYGFANFEAIPLLKKDTLVEKDILVQGGKEQLLCGLAGSDFSALKKKGSDEGFQKENMIDSSIIAPIAKGDKIGFISIKQEGVELAQIPIIADRDIATAGVYDYLKRIINNWVVKELKNEAI